MLRHFLINYYEYFGLPVRLNLNQSDLRKLYYENSRKYHPDFYTLEEEERQEEVLRFSTLNNEAYNVLKNDNKRLKHLLEIKGAIKEGEKEELSQLFLMEMMEINETIMDLQLGDADPTKLTELEQNINQLTDTLNTEIKRIGNSELNESEIASLKECYFRMKYINRLKENIRKL